MRHVAFIRAIMLGRQGVSRDGLLEAFTAAGAGDPRSHIATGNVSFTAPADAIPELVSQVEERLLQMAGAEKRVYVRSVERLQQLEATDPFALSGEHVYERCVSFLPPEAEPPSELLPISPRGDYRFLNSDGDAVFSVNYLIGGRPGNPSARLERALGVPVTTRNWNTILRVLRANEDLAPPG